MVPEVRIKKLYDDVVLPSYQTAQAAGMDVAAYVPEPVTLQPMERHMIPTGLQIALPEGYEAQVRARSGLSLKHGITMVNGIGTIDADYRGEVGILLINLGNEPFVVEPGMRIAQLVFTKYSVVAWREVASLEASERGAGGFGSTGVA